VEFVLTIQGLGIANVNAVTGSTMKGLGAKMSTNVEWVDVVEEGVAILWVASDVTLSVPTVSWRGATDVSM